MADEFLLLCRPRAKAVLTVIDQMCGGFRHPPGVARGADAAALTEEGDEEILSALAATRPGEAIGRDALLKVGTPLALGVRRDVRIFPGIPALGIENLLNPCLLPSKCRERPFRDRPKIFLASCERKDHALPDRFPVPQVNWRRR
jgi:hypothetical protein